MRNFWIFLVFLGSGEILVADEITLKNNNRKIEGVVKEEGDLVIVEIGIGQISFRKEDVLTIVYGRTPLHDYKDRAEALKKNESAQGHYELAMFSKENRLSQYVKQHLKRALELDSNHEGARRASGFTLYKGKWMTEDEVNVERGFIRFEGKWMTPAEVVLIQDHRLRQEERRFAAEEEKRKKEEERQERWRKLQEEESKRYLDFLRQGGFDTGYPRDPERPPVPYYPPNYYHYYYRWPGLNVWDWTNPIPWQAPCSPLYPQKGVRSGS